jgi:hypothetical protein
MMERFSQTIKAFSSDLDNCKLVYEGFDYSTADIEASIFFGASQFEPTPQESIAEDINGVVRLIDGKLFGVANLVPPNSTPVQKTSGLFKLAVC